MDPLTLALLGSAGVSAVGGIAQFLSSKDANNASQEQLNQLKDLASKIQQPDFDVKNIPPAQLQVLQQYAPAIASYVPEKSPELVKAMSAGAQAGRGAQLNALNQYEGAAQSGTDPLLEMAQAKALRQASAASGSAIATANQNMAQRGMTPGGGLGYAAQLSQAAGAQDALSQAGMANAGDQYNRRMSALGNSAQLGGQIRGEDVSQEQGNAGILNDYNRRMADMSNQYNQYQAGQQNQAQMYNMGQNQQTANANVENAYNNQVMNRNYGNQQKQQTYSNSLNKLNTQFGLGGQQMQQNQQQANTFNRGVQGLTDFATTGAMGYANRQDTLAQRAKEDERYNQNQTYKRNYMASNDPYNYQSNGGVNT